MTHTPRKKGLHYTGGPESKAGQLIFRFLRSVDPKMTNTAVSTALARAIKGRAGATASMGGAARTI